ncbi:uncharacterized protein HaLaN_00913, partial [Haematococcus lacustris]
QILDFFKEFRVVRIAFVGEPDGRPSGLAFAEFETRDEAVRALSKNGQFIGERYVRLLHVTKNEMEEQSRLGTLAIPGAAAKLRSRILRSQSRGPFNPYMFMAPQLLLPPGLLTLPSSLNPTLHPSTVRGLPYRSSPADILAFFQGYQYLPDSLQIGLDTIGRPSGVSGLLAASLACGCAACSARASGGQRGGWYDSYFAWAMASVMQQYEVAIEPVKTTLFTSLVDKVVAQQEGQGPGEAWLSFSSPQEAMRSVKELNRQFMGNRYLELSLV